MPAEKKSIGIEPDVWRILQQRKLDTGVDIYQQIRELVEGNAPKPNTEEIKKIAAALRALAERLERYSNFR